mmetsp:Transcript_15541/g.18468  ORF Transcript_15541/g.18468 Transcript_15541/m.18468 type:complete len:123 (+) Transcript_15541:145-513(+)
MLETVSYMKNKIKLNRIFGEVPTLTFRASRSASQNQQNNMKIPATVNKLENRKKLFNDIRRDDGDDDNKQHDTTRRKFKPRREYENDDRYQKYFKMLSVGIPRNAVIAKITQDGLDPSAIEE